MPTRREAEAGLSSVRWRGRGGGSGRGLALLKQHYTDYGVFQKFVPIVNCILRKAFKRGYQ